MTESSRAFVALVSGELAMRCTAESVNWRENGQIYTFKERSVVQTAQDRTCGVVRDGAADNYCLSDPESSSHICLSLFGRWFEGFDHGSASHFNGIIDGADITFYDFSESNYYTLVQ